MYMKTRAVELKDYSTLVTWWLGWGWPPVPVDMLPQTGVIVENSEGVPLVAAFLYRTDSRFCILEYLISNPNVKLNREAAVRLCVDTLIKRAESMGFGAIFTSCQHPKLIESYKAAGFVVGDVGATNLIRRLG